MSNFARKFKEDEQFQSTIISQSSKDSPNPTENGYPEAEVVALSPRTLMAINRYVCEVCHKGFQRDQNLQLHRREHSLPWKLKQRPNTQVKKRVSTSAGSMERRSGSVISAQNGMLFNQIGRLAHTKICGTREYWCDCGTIFSRKDSFVTHRAFCDALAEENYRVNTNLTAGEGMFQSQEQQELFTSVVPSSNSCSNTNASVSISNENTENSSRPSSLSSAGVMNSSNLGPLFNQRMSRAPYIALVSPNSSATALLQKAAEMGAKISDNTIAPILLRGFTGYSSSSTNSSVFAHEGSSNLGLNAVGANSLIIEEHSPEDSRPRHSVSQTALFESPHFVHSGNGNAGSLLGEVHMGGKGEKMTVNFLGGEPGGVNPSTSGKRRYEGNMVGFECPNLHSYW
ncbi:hypothetical protein SLEP1_g9568 [Rubroshorea leprosula]|uniref:C2H2-type domain-containing protein n=1 Tax=Rubroshorea leprosula TaxID=152421 RepID=A0AAV5I5B1_9ROSI|nr:hypothetical protein SLEP1_g9568 [Rubroshorea leprosula]